MIKSIGNRAHDFGKLEPNALAQAVADKELGSIQLALNKAIAGIDDISIPLRKERVKKIAAAMRERSIKISVLGCYLNYAHPNHEQRLKHIEIFRQHLEYAKLLGARVVGTETGSILEDYSYHPDNHTECAYDRFKESLVKMAELAEEEGVDMALEGVATHIIHNNRLMRQLLDEVKSDRINIIFDPVNLLTVDNYQNQEEIMKEAFTLFEDEIIVVHAKDFVIKNNKIVEIPPGEGMLNYKYLKSLMEASKKDIDILIENVYDNKIAACKKYILR